MSTEQTFQYPVDELLPCFVGHEKQNQPEVIRTTTTKKKVHVAESNSDLNWVGSQQKEVLDISESREIEQMLDIYSSIFDKSENQRR